MAKLEVNGPDGGNITKEIQNNPFQQYIPIYATHSYNIMLYLFKHNNKLYSAFVQVHRIQIAFYYRCAVYTYYVCIFLLCETNGSSRGRKTLCACAPSNTHNKDTQMK